MNACKKECNENKINSPYKGKIKMIMNYEDSTNSFNRFYFFYDSTNGSLKSVDVQNYFFGIDTFIVGYLNIVKQSNGNIIFYDNFHNEQYTISLNNKKIVKIIKNNSLPGPQEFTQLFYTNDHLDSIYDFGSTPAVYDISYNHFKYINERCFSYAVNWIENLSGTQTRKFDTTNLYYSNITYTGTTVSQLPVTLNWPDGGTYLNTILFYLSLDGYYITPKSNYLLDSVITTSGIKTKYSYIYSTNNNISKVNVIKNSNTNYYSIIEYY